ncbi:MAG: hypothetical protein SWK90_10985 [Chloroflexota bacterium]|nr:hypothetical protein [Chloroflexota bacterium]
MKTSQSLKVSMIIMTLVVPSLIAVTVVAGWPRQTLATAGTPHAIEMVSTKQTPALTSVADSIVIDHNCVDAAAIPQAWLDQARGQVTFFNHKSIGTNTLEGMADLQSQDAGRYSIDVRYGTGTSAGINHYQAGDNEHPMDKISGFAALVSDGHNIAFMKFCPSDLGPSSGYSAHDIWIAYRDMLIEQQSAHPDTVLVWWTVPLTTQSDARGLDSFAEFNDYVRSYVAANGGILFDIADIESHDPSGNPITAGGYEAMWDNYASDSPHLNETGRQRVASAMWWLLARLAGWGDTNDWISVTADNDVASVYPGETATFALSVTGSEGFSDAVTLDLQGEPAGATVSFDPHPVTPPGTSQLYVTTSDSTPAGIYAMTVTGTSGQVTDSTPLTLTVNPTLALTAQPDIYTVLPGDTAAYTLSVTVSDGFAASVTLTLQDEPPGGAVSFDPNPVTPPGTSQLYITTATSTVPGIYAMTVTGTSGALTDTADLTLIVASATPSFTLSIAPTTRTASPNQVVSYTTAVAGINGFSQPVSLTVIGLPAGVNTAWSVNPVAPDDSSILTLSIPSNPQFGDHSLQVVGTAGMQLVTEGIDLTIVYPFRVYLPTILRQV